jgi:hypothetical protein
MGDPASAVWRPPAAALDPPAEPVPIQPRSYYHIRPQVRVQGLARPRVHSLSLQLPDRCGKRVGPWRT